MDDRGRVSAAGLLLAAGGGRRLGMPKALVRGDDGVPWVVRGARLLVEARCSPVVVVLGAGADEAERLLRAGIAAEPTIMIVRVADWEAGMSVSLAAGLRAVSEQCGPGQPSGVVVTLVDLPDLTVEAIVRVSGVAATVGDVGSALVQATYGERPGHPVYLGRAHWAAVESQLAGDSGARSYLESKRATRVDCSDLNRGEDVDSYPQ